MKCPDAQIMAEYLSGEISLSQRQELEIHVDSCANCSALLAHERILDKILRTQRRIPAPPELLQQVLAALEAPKVHRSSPEWMWVLSMGVAVILTGFALGILGSPYLEGLKLWFHQHVFSAGVLKSIMDLGYVPKADWLRQVPGINSVSLVNLGVAGIILCWGLWQMFKALRR
jgi:hypothetical protein